jgi:hypothetical protein
MSVESEIISAATPEFSEEREANFNFAYFNFSSFVGLKATKTSTSMR